MTARGGRAAAPRLNLLRRKRVRAPVCAELLDIGRVRHPEEANVRLGANDNAFLGAFRLWDLRTASLELQRKFWNNH